MNADEKRVLDAIDYEGMYKFLGDLVSIPSYEGHESKAQWFMAKTLEEHGFTVDQWEIDFDTLSKHPDFSISYEREEGLGVVGVKGPDGGKSLIIAGHIDTVSPGDIDNWDSLPLEATLRDGRIYGRGTCDMKGGIAAALYAVKAVTDTKQIERFCKEAIKENQKAVEDYKAGEKKALQFLIGMVMKKTKGQADPTLVNKIFSDLLK